MIRLIGILPPFLKVIFLFLTLFGKEVQLSEIFSLKPRIKTYGMLELYKSALLFTGKSSGPPKYAFQIIISNEFILYSCKR